MMAEHWLETRIADRVTIGLFLVAAVCAWIVCGVVLIRWAWGAA